MKSVKKRRLAALLLALALLLTACSSSGSTVAATMHLVKTRGAVQVADAKGRDMPVIENLGLYTGYGVITQAESYGWLKLDDTKLAKMDETSAVEVRKIGKLLDLVVTAGGLFFNVTEPLADDEVMTISTSSMMVGIRGTCGWVEVDGADWMSITLIGGTVECSVLDDDGSVLATGTVTAGQTAQMTRRGGTGAVTVTDYDGAQLPEYVTDACYNPDSWPLLPGQKWLDAAELEWLDAAGPSVSAPESSLVLWEDAGLTDHVMDWRDSALEQQMREVTGIAEGDILLSDVWELTELRLQRKGNADGLQDLGALAELTNLKRLELEYQLQLLDLGPLAALTNLEMLHISHCPSVSDLGPLAALTNLEMLHISHCPSVSDLGPLAGLTHLRELWITEAEVSDLGPLAGLTHLTRLDLDKTKVSDLTPLAGLTDLETLWVRAGEVSDLTPLAGLTNLTVLSLANNRISDLTPLAGLTNLTVLSLANNRLDDVTPLANLRNLERLSLFFTGVGDISPVSFVPELDYDDPADLPAVQEALRAGEEARLAEEAQSAAEEAAAAEIAALLAAYAGTYTPYPTYNAYSGGRSVTLQADGVILGGETDGRAPTSILQNANGTVSILFGSSERYTLFPVGTGTPDGAGSDPAMVNLEYLYTGGGAMNIIYYIDPASLGAS